MAVPVLAEFLFGIGMAPRATQNMDEWQRLKPDFDYHDATVPDAEQAADRDFSAVPGLGIGNWL